MSIAMASGATGHKTILVLLGTGTPVVDPNHSGPCTAVVVGGEAYLFDAGPGVVRRAAEAYRNGIAALNPINLRHVFFTHLHSDHTAGYPDLILTPWPVGRRLPLEAYGPKGLKSMTEHIQMAYKEDHDVRIHGLESLDPMGAVVNVHEIEAGTVYKDENVTIQAFPVKHGSWIHAFGYRIQGPDRVIVLSGDTAPTQAVVDACNGCDILVHEVHSGAGPYMGTFHTSIPELAEIANKAKPKLLVLYHQLYLGRASDRDLVDEIHKLYSGVVVSGQDLDVF